MVNRMLKLLKEAIIDFLYPPVLKCVVCEKELDRDFALCDDCVARIEFVEADFCLKCGRISEFKEELCPACQQEKLYFKQARAVGAYSKGLKEYIKLLKFNRQRQLVKPLARLLEATVLRFYNLGEIDYLSYIPSHREKKLERGFNQAQLLAEELANRLSLPCKKVLSRKKLGKTQSKLSREERFANIEGSFGIVDKKAVTDKKILLVDDIYTTGATVNEASKLLSNNQAREIKIVTLATGRKESTF